MSKSANAGELRTPVYFFEIERTVNANGFPTETTKDVFSGPVMCKWVNAHGSEVWSAMQLNLKNPVTLTARYSPKINERLIVYRGSEYAEAQTEITDAAKKAALAKIEYEIISVDDVQNRHEWMEIKIQRKVSAR